VTLAENWKAKNISIHEATNVMCVMAEEEKN
jgi:hypothetical protein